MKLSYFAVAAALAVSSFAVSASTLEILEIDKGQTTYTSNPHPYGAFFDVYQFDLSPEFVPFGNQAVVAYAFTELLFKPSPSITYTDITFGSVIFSRDQPPVGGGLPVDIIISGTPVPGPGGPADTLSFAGFYVDVPRFYMTITGTAVGTGDNAGSYSFEIEAAPVPEPATYSLALGGLALIGVAASKRRRVAAQSAA
jgi:hypothetical protein